MSKKIKIFLVDDHDLFREGLKFLLSATDLNTEISEAVNGVELFSKISDVNPDIILMDIEMPLMNGITATRKVTEKYPNIKVMALSMYANESFYSEMIEAGAVGFILKNSKFSEVETAIKTIMEGKNYFSPDILESIVNNMYHKNKTIINTGLTDRETEILYNICKGFSNIEISEFLNISKRTVDKHRENILLKTNSKNTAGLVIYAIKNNIFEV